MNYLIPFLILENMQQARSLVAKLGGNETDIDFITLRKLLEPNFGYFPLFIKFRYRDKISIERIKTLYGLISQYRQLLTSRKIQPLTYDNFEKLDDDINRAIIYNEDLKFAKSFISNKYIHLLDDEGIKLFGEIRKHESSHSKIQEYLTKKIAAYKTPQEFNEALKKLLNSLAGNFDSDTISIEVESKGGEIVHQDKNCIIAKIPNFEVSKKLGSTSWCISRNASYWKQYVNNYGIQYFVWTFSLKDPRKYKTLNLNVSDNRSLIGITVDFNGRVTAAHDKSDDDIFYSYTYEKILGDNIKYIKGPTKEDIINCVKNGYIPTYHILSKFEISTEDILKIDPHYFKKAGEFFDEVSKTKNIDDLTTFLKRRKGFRKEGYYGIIFDLINSDKWDDVWKAFNTKLLCDDDLLSLLDSYDKLFEYWEKYQTQILKSYKSDFFLFFIKSGVDSDYIDYSGQFTIDLNKLVFTIDPNRKKDIYGVLPPVNNNEFEEIINTYIDNIKKFARDNPDIQLGLSHLPNNVNKSIIIEFLSIPQFYPWLFNNFSLIPKENRLEFISNVGFDYIEYIWDKVKNKINLDLTKNEIKSLLEIDDRFYKILNNNEDPEILRIAYKHKDTEFIRKNLLSLISSRSLSYKKFKDNFDLLVDVLTSEENYIYNIAMDLDNSRNHYINNYFNYDNYFIEKSKLDIINLKIKLLKIVINKLSLERKGPLRGIPEKVWGLIQTGRLKPRKIGID